MNIRSKLAVVVAILGILSVRSSEPARAEVLFDNLSNVTEGSDPAGSAGYGPLYDSFSTGAGGFSLSQIGLLLATPDPSGSSFTISVFGGQSFPASLLFSAGTFSDAVLSSTNSPFYVSFAPVFLAANTRYWVELSTTGSVEWAWTLDSSGIGVAGEFFQNQGGVFDNSNGPYQMQLSNEQVSAVPEPSSWAMMILGFVGLVFMSRFRARHVRSLT